MDKIEEWDKENQFRTWSFQDGLTMNQIVDGDDVYFYNTEGDRYLDFASQLICSNLGHSNQQVIESMAKQAKKISYIAPPFTTEVRAKLSKKLADLTPGDLKKVFYSTSGTEANEGALKIAKYFTGKRKFISRYRSYHGSTYGSISLTGDLRRIPAEPGIPGAIKAPDPYCYRCSFDLEYPDCDLACVNYIDEMLHLEGDTIAAVFVEPIVGSNGIIVPPDGYMKRLREICNEHEALLVSDEVMTGFGRTGEWFGMDLWDVTPDIMTMAKGITGAYAPLGATIVDEKIVDFFDDNMFCHGHTYSGHPIATAAGKSALEEYVRLNLIDNAKNKGDYLGSKLKDLKEKHESIGDVRGVGLFWGLELVKNRQTKEPFGTRESRLSKETNVVDKVIKKAREIGLYVVGVHSTLLIGPPLIITEEKIDEALEKLDEALEVADSKTK
ncbi:aminotransferase class III-fold pyridoxal phosphate-dependent enzyme [Candidatus Bipolaricaulota bacterium]|nr:aminotransferase class III-fold pyridoxal phosphate-dependent enzyme [Candidatus Bipolaricaulota bacterium]